FSARVAWETLFTLRCCRSSLQAPGTVATELQLALRERVKLIDRPLHSPQPFRITARAVVMPDQQASRPELGPPGIDVGADGLVQMVAIDEHKVQARILKSSGGLRRRLAQHK